jgi:hypothetical protein
MSTSRPVGPASAVGRPGGLAGGVAVALTGGRHLKNEGRVAQAKSSVKNAVDSVADTLGGAVDSVTGHKNTRP